MKTKILKIINIGFSVCLFFLLFAYNCYAKTWRVPLGIPDPIESLSDLCKKNSPKIGCENYLFARNIYDYIIDNCIIVIVVLIMFLIIPRIIRKRKKLAIPAEKINTQIDSTALPEQNVDYDNNKEEQ